MADADINLVLPNSVYTVMLYDNNAVAPALLATYTEVVPVKPALNTAMATLAYPSITGMVNLAGISATTLTPSWSIPAGLTGDLISVNMNQTLTAGINASLNVQADLTGKTATSGTATIVITAPPQGGAWTSGSYWINTFDQYGGKVLANYY
jgi:hypothetical protein